MELENRDIRKGQAAERPFRLEVIRRISIPGNTGRFPVSGASFLLLLKLTFVLLISTCCHGTWGPRRSRQRPPESLIRQSFASASQAEVRTRNLQWRRKSKNSNPVCDLPCAKSCFCLLNMVITHNATGQQTRPGD